MIQYRTRDGKLGQVDESSCRIQVTGDTFTITKRKYGYDEYDFWDETIDDIIELRIG